MITADTFLIIAAIVCFLLAAFGVNGKVSWVPLGYACLSATLLF